MQTFDIDGRCVSVNDTDEDIVVLLDGGGTDVIETYISELISLPPSILRAVDHPSGSVGKHRKTIAEHESYVDAILREHAKGLVLLSPARFTLRAEHRVTIRAAERIVRGTPLGRSLEQDLGAVGLFGFIDSLKDAENQTSYRNLMKLIMASLCVSVTGAGRVSELPPEAFVAWVRYFRDDSGNRWREEPWGSRKDVAFQCFRELAYAYGRCTGHNTVGTALAQKRSDSLKLSFWADIEKNSPGHIAPWLKLFQAWRTVQPSLSKNYKQMFMHLVRWLGLFEPSLVGNVRNFLSTPGHCPTFFNYVTGVHRENAKSEAGTTFVQTLAYAKRFSEFIAPELSMGRVFFHLVSEADMSAAKVMAKSKGRASRPAEAKSRPLPMRLYRMTREILAEGETGWPGRTGLCRETIIDHIGMATTIYCPVMPTLFLSLFELPLRVGQMKRLDSGEGDVERFDADVMSWCRNTGPSAGYWAKEPGNDVNRGYAHRLDGQPPITGFAVNTNKTGSPYVVPWQNEELHRMLFRLKIWQETYNPISSPIGPILYVDGADDAEAGKLDDYPEIFPLFRLPVDRRSGRQGCPPNGRRTNEFWQQLMAELERRWNETNAPEDHIKIVSRQEKTGQPYGAKYNPHGLRVAGLTLMVQTKVPIEVVSKLVAGHKTILMTLYYAKLDPASVHAALEEAAQSREAEMVAASVRDFKSMAFEAAQRRAAFISDDGLRAATAMDPTNKMLWSDTGLGICPWDGTRCADGGPILRRDKRPNGSEFNLYAPVEGGERNCVLCRHFVTGPAWRTPLWLYGTKLTRQLASKAARIGQLQQEVDQLYLRATTGDGQRQRVSREIERHELEINRLSHEQETLGKAIWNVHRLLEICTDIDASQTPDGSQDGALIVNDQTSVVEYVGVSEFEQAAIITAAGRIYPVVQDAEAEAARDRFLDAVLWHSGGQPLTLAPLSEEAKRRGLDALASLILQRVEREEIAALAAGSLRLQDLRLDGEAVAAVSAAAGLPIRLAVPTSQGALPAMTSEGA